MAEYTPATLYIGGDFRQSFWQDLLSCLWKDRAVEGGNCSIEDYVSDGLLKIECERAEHGEFEFTEHFCQRNGIAYDRHHGMYGGIYFGSSVYFRPGMSVPVNILGDDEGNEVVDGVVVREALKELLKFGDPERQTSTLFDEIDRSSDSDVVFRCKAVLEATTMLRNLCPEIPEKLQPFNLIFG